jgi:hypothetical protein
MIEFSVTMRHKRAVRPLPANALRRKLCWHSKCRQWASRLVEGELRLATTPDEDPETDRSVVSHARNRENRHLFSIEGAENTVSLMIKNVGARRV